MKEKLKLKQQGKIRAIGVSNVSLDELKENVRCGGIASDQFRYSMLHREAERDILPYCARYNLATLTYMSLEQGLLTGKIGMDRVFQPGEFRSNTYWNDWLIPVNRRRVLDLLASWQPLTDKYRCTLSQLVLAWTAAQPGVTHVLAGGRNITQVTENARAGELNLEQADLEHLRRLHRDQVAAVDRGLDEPPLARGGLRRLAQDQVRRLLGQHHHRRGLSHHQLSELRPR